MRGIRFASLCASLVCLAASGASAQAPGTATPEAAVHAYNDAVARGDWEAAAELIAPDDLQKLVDLAQLIHDFEPFTASMMGLDPEAEPADLLSSFIGIAMNETPGLDEMVASAEITILGEVYEGDDSVHIVTRSASDFHGKPMVLVEAITLQRIDGRWRYRLSGELDAVRAGMELAIEQPELFMSEGDYDDIEVDEAAPRDPKKQ